MTEKRYKSGNKKGQVISERSIANLKLGRMTDDDYETYKKEHKQEIYKRKVKCSTRGCNKFTLRPKGQKYRCYFHRQLRVRSTAREWARVSRLRKTVMQTVRHLMPQIVKAVKEYDRKRES